MSYQGKGPAAITYDDVDNWLENNKYTSPTDFALDHDIDPEQLANAVRLYPVVKYAIYRMIGRAEAWLMQKVYGPTAYIKRCELYLGTDTVGNADLGKPEDEDAGLFKAV